MSRDQLKFTVSRYTSPTHGKFCTLECRDPCNAMQTRHVRPTFPITPPASFGTKLQSIIGTMQVTQNWTIPSQAIATAILVSISTTQGLNLLKNKKPHNITSKYLSQLVMNFKLKRKREAPLHTNNSIFPLRCMMRGLDELGGGCFLPMFFSISLVRCSI